MTILAKASHAIYENVRSPRGEDGGKLLSRRLPVDRPSV